MKLSSGVLRYCTECLVSELPRARRYIVTACFAGISLVSLFEFSSVHSAFWSLTLFFPFNKIHGHDLSSVLF